MSEPIKDVRLPRHAPWWTRKLGLKIDWQSRPTDRERTYHSHDRKTEITLGFRNLLTWSIEVSRWDEHTNLHIGTPWFQYFRRIGPGGEVPIGEMCVSWGITAYEGSLSFEWGEWRRSFRLNPFRWDGYELSLLRLDGEWDTTPTYTDEGKEIEWYEEFHPYAIASLPEYYSHHHEGPKVVVEVWRAQATCRIERTIRTRRWLPFWRRIDYSVAFSLDEEVGRGKGSWKGGTVGFSHAMLPGDSIREVVNRACKEGRGR